LRHALPIAISLVSYYARLPLPASARFYMSPINQESPMNISIKASAVLLAILLINSAWAGLRELTYQGQLYESGAAVNATKYFQFQLISNSTFIAWTSYGSGSGRVALNVSKGFFSVRLGDTTIANMAALPADLFNNENDVYLKVFVGDVAGALTELSPANKITSAAYAMSTPIVLTNGTVIYGGAQGNSTAAGVINMTGAPLLTKPVWDDILVPADTANKHDAAPPSYVKFGSGSSDLYSYDFDKDNDESLLFTMQIPHTYKKGTNLRPHMHWTVKTTVNSGNVVWGLEYMIRSFDATYPADSTTIITAATAVPTVYKHVITSLPEISGTGLKESSVLVGRMFRDANHALDTFNADATLLEIDFHFQVEKMGTITEFPD